MEAKENYLKCLLDKFLSDQSLTEAEVRDLRTFLMDDKSKPVMVDVFDGVVVFRNETPEKVK